MWEFSVPRKSTHQSRLTPTRQQAIGTTQINQKIQLCSKMKTEQVKRHNLDQVGLFKHGDKIWTGQVRVVYSIQCSKQIQRSGSFLFQPLNERAKASPAHGLADFITRTCSSGLKKLLMIWLNGRESLKEGSFKDRSKIFDWGFDENKAPSDRLGQNHLWKLNIIQAFI